MTGFLLGFGIAMLVCVGYYERSRIKGWIDKARKGEK